MASAPAIRTPPDAGERAHETRLRILEAAARCFAKFGFARTRSEDVANAAGVSRALVYRYCGDRRSLLVAVRSFVLEQWRAEIDAACEDARSGAERLAAWLRVNARYAARQPSTSIAMPTTTSAIAIPGNTDSHHAR